MVDHDSIVQAAGTLRRIANRLTEISMGRIRAALSRLDDATEAAPVAILAAIRARLETWLEFIEERSGLHQCQASNRVRQSFAQRNPPTPGRIQSAGCATIKHGPNKRFRGRVRESDGPSIRATIRASRDCRTWNRRSIGCASRNVSRSQSFSKARI
jgi:hypothetical protein